MAGVLNAVNDIQALMTAVQDRLPNATLKMVPPVDPAGTWTLDCSLDKTWVVIEWTAPTFGVSRVTAETGYGERPDHVLDSLDLALERTVELLTNG